MLLRISCLHVQTLNKCVISLIPFSLLYGLILNIHRHYRIPSHNQQFYYYVALVISFMPFHRHSWLIDPP
jgi:hypothetical protein